MIDIINSMIVSVKTTLIYLFFYKYMLDTIFSVYMVISCVLDSILVNKLNGPASVWAVRCRPSMRPATSYLKRDRRSEDRGTVMRIPDSIHYKRRSTHMEKDTLKTLERATPTHRSCFHLA